MEVKRSTNNGKRGVVVGKDDNDADCQKKGNGPGCATTSRNWYGGGEEGDVKSRACDKSDLISLESGKLITSKGQQQGSNKRQGTGKRKHDKNSFVSPLLACKKKKKKNPKIAKRGDLMDFLSSLND